MFSLRCVMFMLLLLCSSSSSLTYASVQTLTITLDSRSCRGSFAWHFQVLLRVTPPSLAALLYPCIAGVVIKPFPPVPERRVKESPERSVHCRRADNGVTWSSAEMAFAPFGTVKIIPASAFRDQQFWNDFTYAQVPLSLCASVRVFRRRFGFLSSSQRRQLITAERSVRGGDDCKAKIDDLGLPETVCRWAASGKNSRVSLFVELSTRLAMNKTCSTYESSQLGWKLDRGLPLFLGILLEPWLLFFNIQF